MTIQEALEVAYGIGMHQHREEIEPFAAWLTERKPHHVIEIGTLHGGTAALWHAVATGLVISVDKPDGRWGGASHHYSWSRAEERNRQLRDRFPRFRGVLGDSGDVTVYDEVRGYLGREQADLLFVDGDHSFLGVSTDYALYSRLVAPGGVIAFHDVDDTEMHARDGVDVGRFFQSIPGHKRVLSCGAPWGGIGVSFR